MTKVTEINKQEREFKLFEFEVQDVKQEERNGQKIGIVKGLGSTFDLDRGNDIVMPGAFVDTIARHKQNNRPVRMLFSHFSQNLIGGFPISKVMETERGLEVEGEINLLKGHMGEWVYSLAQQGVLSDFSIGFKTLDDEWKDGVRLIKKLELYEISLVSEPMNENARVTSVKDLSGENRDILTQSIKEYCHKIGLKDFDQSKPLLTLEDVNEIETIRDFEKSLHKAGYSQKAAAHMAHIAKSNQWDTGKGLTRRDAGSKQLLNELEELKNSFK